MADRAMSSLKDAWSETLKLGAVDWKGQMAAFSSRRAVMDRDHTIFAKEFG